MTSLSPRRENSSRSIMRSSRSSGVLVRALTRLRLESKHHRQKAKRVLTYDIAAVRYSQIPASSSTDSSGLSSSVAPLRPMLPTRYSNLNFSS